jgi:5-hydroxyisourate hydrolase
MKITAQVLDGTFGKAVDSLRVGLERSGKDGWFRVAEAQTDSDGRIVEWSGRELECDLYRIKFDTDRYFADLGTSTAYPEVIIVFRAQKEFDVCQVQVTLSPYSYSTHFRTEIASYSL